MYESLDIETIWDNDIAKPICIAITNNDKIDFAKIDVDNIDNSELMFFMLEKCSEKKIYYVHNLTFEIFVFLNDFIKNNIKFKIISANKTVYSADIFYKNKKIKLRCSYKLTMLSLRNLAKMANIEEKGIFPYSILNKNLKEYMTINKNMFNTQNEYLLFKKEHGININTYCILEKYCKNDALITKKSIIKYWKIIEEMGIKNNGKILTAAKLSIENYFSKNFVIKKKIKLKFDRILRPSYFGGRTEVFGNLKNNEIALHHDWTGMYSQCMCEKVLGGEVFESNIIKSLDIPGFYWIKFKQNLEIPILPIRTNKLLFMNGTFEGWYWFEEIILAIQYGVEILSIQKTISSQYYDFFIKEFAENNEKIRKISPLHKIIGKNNNNTFYGRLGMDPERLEEEILSNIENTNSYEKIIENNGIYLGYKKKEKTISNILISASITSKARIKLYKGMMEVIKNKGRILYTDTDSIIAAFDKNTYKNILDINLGEVIFNSKLEDTIIKDAVFAMPKTYALKYKNNEIIKIKGFNTVPNFNEFKKKFYNRENITTVNNEWNKKDLLIKQIKKTKQTNLYSLDKRIWSFDLKYTMPLFNSVP